MTPSSAYVELTAFDGLRTQKCTHLGLYERKALMSVWLWCDSACAIEWTEKPSPCAQYFRRTSSRSVCDILGDGKHCETTVWGFLHCSRPVTFRDLFEARVGGMNETWTGLTAESGSTRLGLQDQIIQNWKCSDRKVKLKSVFFLSQLWEAHPVNPSTSLTLGHSPRPRLAELMGWLGELSFVIRHSSTFS